MKDVQVVYESTATTADHNINFVTPSTGGIFVIDVTADPASASVTFTIQGLDPADDAVWTILESTAIAAVGTTVLRVHPSLTASNNLIAKDALPQGVRINCNHVDGDSLTYSVSFIGFD